MGESVFSARAALDKEFNLCPWRYSAEPFRILGNLYYVGNLRVCMHLIDTGDGLILIDTGHPHTSFMLFHSIWQLGFRPSDVKYIIFSHGHFDHVGGAGPFVELYHTKTFLGAADVQVMKEQGEGRTCTPFEAVTPDQLLYDGDTVELGNTEIQFVSVPGHSPGSMAMFWDIHDGEHTYRAGAFGGIGLLTLSAKALEEFGLPLSLQQDFANSLQKVKNEPVDVVVGNHPWDNDTFGKYNRLKENPSGENPFINPNEWKEMLEKKSAEFEEFLKTGDSHVNAIASHLNQQKQK